MSECRKFLRYDDNVAYCFIAVLQTVSGYEVRTAAGPPGQVPATRIHPTRPTFDEALQRVDEIVEEYCGNRGYTIAWEHMDSNSRAVPWLEYKVRVKGSDIVEPDWFVPAARMPGLPGVNVNVQANYSDMELRAMAEIMNPKPEHKPKPLARKRAPWNF